MRPPSYVFSLFVVAASVVSSSDGVRSHVTNDICLRFTEPLGYSVSGTRERGDAKWYVLQLGDSGVVARPLFPSRERELWPNRSRWTTKGDTLLVRVSDGLVGWDLALRRERDEFQGLATYLTDVYVKGAVRLRREVHASTTTCPVPSA